MQTIIKIELTEKQMALVQALIDNAAQEWDWLETEEESAQYGYASKQDLEQVSQQLTGQLPRW
jgi:hypothetical protein